MKKSEIGVYGLGVMGSSIAMNIANHGHSVTVFNREAELTKNFERKVDSSIVLCTYDVQEFIESLEKPRKILIMVTAGSAVDSVIESLKTYVETGDIIMDGGNSHFEDTMRRFNTLEGQGYKYLGIGISGGEQGALHGPSIMPSGEKDTYKKVKCIFEDISAKANDGSACCDYIGESGSGHYVKMVHNGIEYADIQIICEAYSFLKEGLHLTNDEIQRIFEKWNQGKLQSYLIQITSEILKKRDEITNNYLIDMILDKAEQKGTGKWTAIESFNRQTSIPTIVAAVEARYLSMKKDERVKASKILNFSIVDTKENKDKVIADLESAIYVSKICCYAQGFELLKDAARDFNWNLQFGNIAMIWREGCIIRANFLNEIKEAFENSNNDNLILTEKFNKAIIEKQKDLRETIVRMVKCGIYIPAFTSTLHYLDGYRSKNLSANLLQAQRDFFGAHTYQRIDMQGVFHTIWE